MQSSGKFIIAGNFTLVDGVRADRITRVNSDGTVDLSFDVGSGGNGAVLGVVEDSCGNLILVGQFTAFGVNAEANRITALSPNADEEPQCDQLESESNFFVVPTKNGKSVIVEL